MFHRRKAGESGGLAPHSRMRNRRGGKSPDTGSGRGRTATESAPPPDRAPRRAEKRRTKRPSVSPPETCSRAGCPVMQSENRRSGRPPMWLPGLQRVSRWLECPYWFGHTPQRLDRPAIRAGTLSSRRHGIRLTGYRAPLRPSAPLRSLTGPELRCRRSDPRLSRVCFPTALSVLGSDFSRGYHPPGSAASSGFRPS
jgi:hypothetical protein